MKPPETISHYIESRYANANVTVFTGPSDASETEGYPITIYHGDGITRTDRPVPSRIHSTSQPSDIYGALFDDTREQSESFLSRYTSEVDTWLFAVLFQEGMGHGFDSTYARELVPDLRTYNGLASCLVEMGVSYMELHTNDPRRLAVLREAGIEVVRAPSYPDLHPEGEAHRQKRIQYLGHLPNEVGTLC